LRERLKREERELAEDLAEYEQRKQEEWATHAENLLGLFLGRRRRLTTSLTKRRLTQKALADIEESKAAIAEYKAQIEALEAALQNLEFRLMRREWSLLELALKDEWERGQPPTLDLREAQNGASNGNGSKASSPTSDPEEPGSAGAA